MVTTWTSACVPDVVPLPSLGPSRREREWQSSRLSSRHRRAIGDVAEQLFEARRVLEALERE